MKKKLLTFLITLLIYSAYAQTNTFPSTGNVGIGITSPTDKLDVIGGNVTFYNTGASTVLNLGSGITGKTLLEISTSADASGYGVIQSVSAQGSAWGNIIFNPN